MKDYESRSAYIQEVIALIEGVVKHSGRHQGSY